MRTIWKILILFISWAGLCMLGAAAAVPIGWTHPRLAWVVAVFAVAFISYLTLMIGRLWIRGGKREN